MDDRNKGLEFVTLAFILVSHLGPLVYLIGVAILQAFTDWPM